MNNLEERLHRWNSMSENEALSSISTCCGSSKWAGTLTAARPITSVDKLLLAAEEAFTAITPADWLEAFHSHPRIGENKEAGRTASLSVSWSAEEQASVSQTDHAIAADLALKNEHYLQKFGYIYIVRATGRSPQEMLQLLEKRLSNSPKEEFAIAIEQQKEITRLRLEKWLRT